MTTIRRVLLGFLAISAAVLSFDALRLQVNASGGVHHHALAALWAGVVDGLAAAGLLGLRADRRDLRAWLMTVCAFTASVAFQVSVPPAWLARAVPPVGLFLAVLVLELPRPGAAEKGTPNVEPLSPEVDGGGALPGALPAVAAVAAVWTEGMSGAQLARALTDRGVPTTDRDGRRLLTLLRADPAPTTTNGHRPGRADEERRP
jgi:hypothetical protein